LRNNRNAKAQPRPVLFENWKAAIAMFAGLLAGMQLYPLRWPRIVAEE